MTPTPPQPNTGDERLREKINDLMCTAISAARYNNKGWLDTQIESEAAIMQAVKAELGAAQTNAVAWTVGVIDDMHINGSNLTGTPSFDSLFKGIKNTIRDRYRFEVGIDPAPSYPVKAELRNHFGIGEENHG